MMRKKKAPADGMPHPLPVSTMIMMGLPPHNIFSQRHSLVDDGCFLNKVLGRELLYFHMLLLLLLLMMIVMDVVGILRLVAVRDADMPTRHTMVY